MVPEISAFFFIFKALLVSLLLALIFAWASTRLARLINLIDFPGSAPHKLHTRPTPLAGGIALVSTLVISGYLLGTSADSNVKATLLAGIPVFIFGLWDDFRNISPPIKLGGQIIAALILIHMGVYVRIFESPEFFIHGEGAVFVFLDWLITILWIVGITNAFNLVDSMDGLAVGLGGMAAAFFMLVTLEAQQPELTQHSVVIMGICIGLYFYNSYPALLFLGDSGAQILGFVLAVLAISYNPVGAYQSSSWLVPIMLLGVPVFDTALITISRLRRKRPIHSAARDHTYHRLLRLGLSSNRAVLAMHIVALFLGCLAFIILNQPPFIANTAFLIVLLLGIWALFELDSEKLWGSLEEADLEDE